MRQVLKNHVAILVDTSSSMNHLLKDVVKVFNNQIQFLRQSSLDFKQETRISIYEFNSNVSCLISDVDVARPMEIQSLSGGGMTALFDAVDLSIKDFQDLPQTYGDHSFLIYILTDGMENRSVKHSLQSFKKLIANLPDNFNIAAFVPDFNSKTYLVHSGIPEGNIDKWDVTTKGIETVGNKFEQTITNYYQSRSKGIKKFSTMFSDLDSVTVQDIKTIAQEIKNYNLITSNYKGTIQIRDFVESETGLEYKKGSAYYQLVKNETVQPSKNIAVINKDTGKVYEGKDARVLLNLPNHNVKVTPVYSDKWDVYVQSLSVNRNIIPKQKVLVLQ